MNDSVREAMSARPKFFRDCANEFEKYLSNQDYPALKRLVEGMRSSLTLTAVLVDKAQEAEVKESGHKTCRYCSDLSKEVDGDGMCRDCLASGAPV